MTFTSPNEKEEEEKKNPGDSEKARRGQSEMQWENILNPNNHACLLESSSKFSFK